MRWSEERGKMSNLAQKSHTKIYFLCIQSVSCAIQLKQNSRIFSIVADAQLFRYRFTRITVIYLQDLSGRLPSGLQLANKISYKSTIIWGKCGVQGTLIAIIIKCE